MVKKNDDNEKMRIVNERRLIKGICRVKKPRCMVTKPTSSEKSIFFTGLLESFQFKSSHANSPTSLSLYKFDKRHPKLLTTFVILKHTPKLNAAELTLITQTHPTTLIRKTKNLFLTIFRLQISSSSLLLLLLAMSVESSSGSADHGGHSIKGVPTHGGRYVQYNVYGNLFEVSRKYVPLRPVGRGAYGIVW